MEWVNGRDMISSVKYYMKLRSTEKIYCSSSIRIFQWFPIACGVRSTILCRAFKAFVFLSSLIFITPTFPYESPWGEIDFLVDGNRCILILNAVPLFWNALPAYATHVFPSRSNLSLSLPAYFFFIAPVTFELTIYLFLLFIVFPLLTRMWAPGGQRFLCHFFIGTHFENYLWHIFDTHIDICWVSIWFWLW